MLRKILLIGNKEHTFLAFLEMLLFQIFSNYGAVCFMNWGSFEHKRMSDDTVHLKMKKNL